MPELSLQLVLFIVCVGLFTGAAAVSDIRWRKIPNKLTVPVFALGLIYQIAFNGLQGLGDAGLAFLVGFGSLFVLWLVGGGGGGDVKLMGALAVWLGFRLTLMVLVCSTLFVIIGTVGIMIFSVISRGVDRTRSKFLATGKQNTGKKKQPEKETTQQRTKRRIMAYAVPVTLATWVVVLLKIHEFPFVN